MDFFRFNGKGKIVENWAAIHTPAQGNKLKFGMAHSNPIPQILACAKTAGGQALN